MKNMNWNQILKFSKDNDGIVIMNVDGDLSQFENGIPQVWENLGIKKTGTKILEPIIFTTTDGWKNILFPVNKEMVDVHALAQWRLLSPEDHKWLSDYTKNLKRLHA